jgi:hypothetical protein
MNFNTNQCNYMEVISKLYLFIQIIQIEKERVINCEEMQYF